MTPSERQPEVIVDFLFEDGLFFIAIKNISPNPAYDVSVTFNKKFTGVEGAREISALPLFRNIPFLAPHKEIVAFLDASASYFRRRQPTNIRATITYRDASGAPCESIVRHDLTIYKEIGYIRRPSEARKETPLNDDQATETDPHTC
jgi:hypothetical protein